MLKTTHCTGSYVNSFNTVVDDHNEPHFIDIIALACESCSPLTKEETLKVEEVLEGYIKSKFGTVIRDGVSWSDDHLENLLYEAVPTCEFQVYVKVKSY